MSATALLLSALVSATALLSSRVCHCNAIVSSHLLVEFLSSDSYAALSCLFVLPKKALVICSLLVYHETCSVCFFALNGITFSRSTLPPPPPHCLA